LIIIYLVSVLCGNLLSITSKINTGTFSVGASSGLYGFFGACIGYVIINWNSLFRLGKIRNRLILFLVIYLILAFFPSQASSM
jgi:membrane associated rhomboid family serine protease